MGLGLGEVPLRLGQLLVLDQLDLGHHRVEAAERLGLARKAVVVDASEHAELVGRGEAGDLLGGAAEPRQDRAGLRVVVEQRGVEWGHGGRGRGSG